MNNKIIISDIECDVLKYVQETDEETNAIGMHAIISLSKNEFKDLRQMASKSDYFKVIPPFGEFNNGLLMRFGKIVWAEDLDEVTARIVLVENIYDNSEHYTVFDCLEPELTNVRLLSTKNAAYISALENILLAKGLLTSSDLDLMRQSADNLLVSVFRDIYKVDDLMKYWEFND